MFENLYPVWQEEYNDILHLNTCSTDNIFSLLRLYRSKIEEANDFTGVSQNPKVKLLFELIIAHQFYKLRDQIAKLMQIPVTHYNVFLKKYDF